MKVGGGSKIVDKNRSKKGVEKNKYVTTLTLGLRPRQGLTRVRAKKEARESHFMLP
jgi:hypothetical protein